MNDIKVHDVMTHLVVRFKLDDTIHEAARRMLSNRISGAPVVEDRHVVGIISEADLVAAFTSPAKSRAALAAPDPLTLLFRGTVPRPDRGITVAEVMTKDVVTVAPSASLWEAASLIDRHGVRRLPVVDGEGELVGIVARADLVRSMARDDNEISASVREAVLVLGTESFEGLDIETVAGVVTIMGTADRRSTRDIAVRIAARVPGVLEVAADLDWQWDDTEVGPRGLGRDPWAVGPSLKESAGG